MEQTFATEELKAELERSLGFRLRELKRLDGAGAVNFKAVRESDGLTFAVKCSPFARQKTFDRLLVNLRALEGSKATQRLFERECPPTFCGYNVLCTSWCDGVRIFPDRLTREQLTAFLDDYLDFSAALQRTSEVSPVLDSFGMFRTLLASYRGFWGGLMRRLLRCEIAEESLRLRPESVRTIHSDFHHGNFLFADGRVSGYFDLEDLQKGYPAQDLIRYFVCAAEHLRWYELHRLFRILDCFELAVRRLPYAPDEWLFAINEYFFTKVCGSTYGRRIGPFRYLNLRYKARFYRHLRERLEKVVKTDSRNRA